MQHGTFMHGDVISFIALDLSTGAHLRWRAADDPCIRFGGYGF